MAIPASISSVSPAYCDALRSMQPIRHRVSLSHISVAPSRLYLARARPLQQHDTPIQFRRTMLARAMSTAVQELASEPPVRRGMIQLDKSLFSKSLEIWSIVVPAKDVVAIRSLIGSHSLQLAKISNVLKDERIDPSDRMLLTNAPSQDPPPERIQHVVQEHGLRLLSYLLTLDYDYWTADQILRAILPETVVEESPSGFAQTGHIAHMNLRDEYLPYKHLIGEVILSKSHRLETVVNKLDTIDNEFRVFKMEVIAGKPDFNVTISEEGCSFGFDFSKVYWNSRLQAEHRRLVASFAPLSVIVDAFAGVGPFAIPAAKKSCAVMASDLNPDSARYLRENAESNKVTERMRIDCKDGREYIKHAALDIWQHPFGPPPTKPAKRRTAERAPAAPISPFRPRRIVDHFVMNLPASALEFLDAYRGLYASIKEDTEYQTALIQQGRPLVHCYCFTKLEDAAAAEQDICERASLSLAYPVTPQMDDYRLVLVRAVAPHKDMYCLTFRIPAEVLHAQ
ncbi:uncharacterized protein L969DRAFT_92462 [Mixia osmundae IAM 14324]|uniref:tRNA (guanine(37)-N1)-methyltransferase n=1 Tax=Mixia osmundae (strain CBS 9802 / IAM 14324 / JCM 22182 / KY 12970) TaxID=764103 RepID=G7DXG9_MIXOS|nr:uncharacterized protein L969DRAFT_92462 [Mixia osmundae IAM 14324]KEI41227.1 hypothetical protein L969DRAFT_92462 [Mixia osmundae IAM 14324]GAA95279.1 hypothetical protein E5Q_01935 [Mixia osmundae IAM 14324]